MTKTTQTSAEKTATAIDALKRTLQSTVESGAAAVAKFQAKLADDPVHAFEWSQGIMESSAKARVATILLAWLDASKTVPEVLGLAQGKALQGARFPSFSTSQTTNVMAAFMTAAWAEMTETLTYLAEECK